MVMRFALLIASALLAACGTARPAYTGTVKVASAELVTINPDVKTLADSDQPVFVVDGTYWLFQDGRWWQSRSLRGQFVLEPNPPVPVRQIDQPFAYTNYRKDHPVETTASMPAAVPATVTATATVADEPAKPTTPPNTAASDPSVDPTLNMFQR